MENCSFDVKQQTLTKEKRISSGSLTISSGSLTISSGSLAISSGSLTISMMVGFTTTNAIRKYHL